MALVRRVPEMLLPGAEQRADRGEAGDVAAELVERAFGRLAGSREIVATYEKWFLKPLPSGARLNLPMSPHLEEVFRVQGLPND